MIQKAPSYVTSDGKPFADLKAAQAHELRTLFGENITQGQAEAIDELVDHKEFVIDILTTTASSKPKARKINGGTKKRKAPVVVEKPNGV
jgi:hypothetical protein